MECNKVFIGHGDIMLDKVYDGELNLIMQDGGGSNWNTLYNLGLMGEKCYAIGTRGDDQEGEMALKSLESVDINTKYVEIENKKTNIMNIIFPKEKVIGGNIKHIWYNPITKERTINFSDNLPIKLPKELEEKELYILLDRVRKVNMDFVDNIKNKKVCLDVGHIRYIRYFKRRLFTKIFKKSKCVTFKQISFRNVI